MSAAHPLDRPVWSALCGRQSGFGLTHGVARRFAPQYGLFAAVPDTSAPSLAALGEMVAAHGDVAVVELEPPPPVPGTAVVSSALCCQMIAQGPPVATAGPQLVGRLR